MLSCTGSTVWPFGKKARVLSALGACPREGDHVMSHDPHMDQFLDPPGAQRGPGHAPKRRAIVAKDSNAEQQLENYQDSATQIGWV